MPAMPRITTSLAMACVAMLISASETLAAAYVCDVALRQSPSGSIAAPGIVEQSDRPLTVLDDPLPDNRPGQVGLRITQRPAGPVSFVRRVDSTMPKASTASSRARWAFDLSVEFGIDQALGRHSLIPVAVSSDGVCLDTSFLGPFPAMQEIVFPFDPTEPPPSMAFELLSPLGPVPGWTKPRFAFLDDWFDRKAEGL